MLPQAELSAKTTGFAPITHHQGGSETGIVHSVHAAPFNDNRAFIPAQLLFLCCLQPDRDRLPDFGAPVSVSVIRYEFSARFQNGTRVIHQSGGKRCCTPALLCQPNALAGADGNNRCHICLTRQLRLLIGVPIVLPLMSQKRL